MVTLNDLPIELVIRIIYWTQPRKSPGRRENKGAEDLRNLRLVSRHLNALVIPVLFSSLRLHWSSVGSDNSAVDALRCQDIIIALATQSTRVFEHTTKLEFFPHQLYLASDTREDVAEMQKVLEESIFSAVSALKKLRVVSWHHVPSKAPESISNDFIRALGTLESFEGFTDLNFNGDLLSSFSLKPLSNLRLFRTTWSWDESKHYTTEVASLLTRCPNLRDISFSGGPSRAGKDMKLRDLFAETNELNRYLPLTKLELQRVIITPDDIKDNLHHFQHLKSLSISRNPDRSPSTFGEICSVFKENDIYLTGICTDTPHYSELFDYIASYSGLRKLRLIGGHPLNDSPQLVDRVFRTILPKHKKTLRNLALGPITANSQAGMPTDYQLARIAECQKLRKLEINYCPNFDDMENSDALVLTKYLETGLKLPKLLHLRLHASSDVPSGPGEHSKILKLLRFRSQLIDKFKKERGPRFRINNI